MASLFRVGKCADHDMMSLGGPGFGLEPQIPKPEIGGGSSHGRGLEKPPVRRKISYVGVCTEFSRGLKAVGCLGHLVVSDEILQSAKGDFSFYRPKMLP